MRFRTFPKLPRGAMEATSGGTWVAVEKVHGAQLVVASGPDGILFGKRKAWLTDEPFFGWRLLAARLGVQVKAMARELGAVQLYVWGELCGGGYDHPDVPPIPGLSPVQVGVGYAPDLRWLPFEALVAEHDDDPGVLLSFSDLSRRAAAVGASVPPLIGRGPRAQVASLPMPFQTRVPALFGLPDRADDVAEGLVLKPDVAAPPGARPAYKRKLPRFDDAAMLASSRWAPGLLSPAELQRWLQTLVCGARIASARSKVGTDPARILDEVVLDVGIDLETLFAESWASIAPTEQERLLARARTLASELIGAAPTGADPAGPGGPGWARVGPGGPRSARGRPARDGAGRRASSGSGSGPDRRSPAPPG